MGFITIKSPLGTIFFPSIEHEHPRQEAFQVQEKTHPWKFIELVCGIWKSKNAFAVGLCFSCASLLLLCLFCVSLFFFLTCLTVYTFTLQGINISP